MRNVLVRLATALCLVLALASPSQAQGQPALQSEDPTQGALSQGERSLEEPQTREQRLDALFVELKRARSAPAGEQIAQRIWNEWGKSGSATVDLMMKWAQEAAQAKNNAVALDFLDQVVALKPDYAEGWNRRATLHFTMGNTAKSVSDINRVLALEPRHFGALAGLATILTNAGRKQAAFAVWERALDVYPMMRDGQTAAAELAEDLAGNPI